MRREEQNKVLLILEFVRLGLVNAPHYTKAGFIGIMIANFNFLMGCLIGWENVDSSTAASVKATLHGTIFIAPITFLSIYRSAMQTPRGAEIMRTLFPEPR